MKKQLYFLAIFFLCFGVGCDDGFLDTTPYDGFSSSLIFDNDANATMAMNGVYNQIANVAFSADFYVYISVLGPEGYGHVRGDWGPSHAQGLATARGARITNIYRNFYRPIIYANDVIAGLEGSTKVSKALGERLIGEAKFMRGLCYFYLWNLYGGVVILDEPTPVTETYKERSSKEEVLQFITADFTDAVKRLPVSYPASELGRVTKGAAIAMLGKTYLYNKQWAAAAAEFEKLLSAPYTYKLVANYGDSFHWTTQNNAESVFEIQYQMLVGLGSTFDNWYGHRSMRWSSQDYCETSLRALQAFTNNDGSPVDRSTIPIPKDFPTEIAYGKALTDWYEKTYATVDKRLHQSSILPGAIYIGAGDAPHKVYWPYAPYVNSMPRALRTTFTTDALIPIRKFITIGQENTLSRTDCPTNNPVIRFADVLLMYAEAKNEVSGAGTEVYDALDKVRTRAGVVTLKTFKPGLSKDEMRREIWLERFRELMFEDHLYFDVRRWNVAHTNDPIFGLNNDEYDFRLVTKYYTNVFKAERDYLWPIPGGEIDINPKMTQNPGW